MTLKNTVLVTIQSMLRPLGQRLHNIQQTYEHDRCATFKALDIDLVIDVGANAGQYASQLRNAGYSGKIISLEPLPGPFERLAGKMKNDRNWIGYQVAAGAETGKSAINVSEDSVCSSLLIPSDTLTSAIGRARIVDKIDIDVIKIDDLEWRAAGNIALKLDVQGFERQAMSGGSKILAEVRALEVELSVTEGYIGAYSVQDAIPDLTSQGFKLRSIGRGVSNARGELIDADLMFVRI